MYCKKCGKALPSHGYICKFCGTMMDIDQIKIQKENLRNERNERIEVNLASDKYSKEPINRNYEKRRENKYLGAILILAVMIILLVIAILKVM